MILYRKIIPSCQLVFVQQRFDTLTLQFLNRNNGTFGFKRYKVSEVSGQVFAYTAFVIPARLNRSPARQGCSGGDGYLFGQEFLYRVSRWFVQSGFPLKLVLAWFKLLTVHGMHPTAHQKHSTSGNKNRRVRFTHQKHASIIKYLFNR
ncbi:hypothetical protein [Candidatus Scalindua japonica]|uniref:hypothetical protein n=1 Tax=Candidatus Scalindua japonica TaxID=1284222 RepID=UPI000BDEBA9C|nr:hypothetical protein [Candidatus Scalindua japonica]